MDFQDAPAESSNTQRGGRNPHNYNILKGGKVDPGSKLYQRSVAGRQKLEDYVKDLWDQGKDEKDVFMSAVKSLMNRGHGYVGAYMDSKNPGRRYTEPQAMRIADEVMKNAGIGSHPGARLTPAQDDDERASRQTDRAQRREARKAGPAPAPAAKAKPVGQQRKEGKRTGSAPVAEGDTRRAGIGEPATGPISDWQNTLESRIKGEATTSDVLAAFQKQYQSRIKGGAAKPAEGGNKASGAKPPSEAAPAPEPTSPVEEAKAPAPAEETRPTEEAKAPAPAEGSSAPEPSDETDRVTAPDDVVANAFRKKFNDAKKQLLQQEVALARKERRVANPKVAVPSQDDIDYMVEETVDDLADQFDIDYDTARGILSKRFGVNISEKGGSEPESETETPSPVEQETPQPVVTSKGGFKAPKQPSQRGGGGFTSETGKKAANAIRQAVSEGKTPQQVVETFKQGNLFGKTGFDTPDAESEPRPGPAKERTPEETGDNLLDEQGQAKDFTKSGPQPEKRETARQLPLPLGKENTAAKLKARSDAEGRRLAKQEKALGKPPRPARRTGKSSTQPELFTKSGNPRKFNTSEMSSMSYDEFAQSVRSLIR